MHFGGSREIGSIREDEIGIANHPHFMNPRLTIDQTGLIIPDAIQIARELKERETNEKKAKKKAEKKRKADMERRTEKGQLESLLLQG